MATDRQKLIEFIEIKTSKAESDLKIREEMEKAWRSGTDESWNSAAEIHPSTYGIRSTKADRLKTADSQKRIAERPNCIYPTLRNYGAIDT